MNLIYLRVILFFIKNYKIYVIGILVLSLLYAIFEGLNIAALFPIITSVINIDAGPEGGSGILKFLNALIGIIPVKDIFIGACILVILIVIFKNVFRYMYMVFSTYASYKIWRDIQRRLFSKYISADYKYFLDHKQGEIVYRLYTAPASVGGILKLIPQLLTEILKILTIGIILFSMSFSVTCGIIVIAAIFYFFTRGISRRVSYLIGKGRLETTEEQNILINEMISGIKQIKVFLAEKRWIKRFYDSMDTYFKLAKKDTLWINMPTSALEIFALTALAVFLIAMRRFSSQNLASNLPLIGVFAYAFQRVMPSLSLVTTLKMQIMSDLPVLEMIRSVINETMSDIKDGAEEMRSFNESIRFDRVSFYYPGRPEALDKVTISFEKNKCTAIVGQSGSGKTTLVNLIIRLFDPKEGCVLADNTDIRNYKRESWLSKIGFVSQDTFIFHASVRENIAFGFDLGMDRVIEAAKIANAHDFITKLPNGYDTVVGEKGMKLSGGEQQRIAIARAILRNPQILIFDEATSALDNVSQSLIQSSINKIVKDHTVILIAHRLSTIANADKIIVLDNGIIKETGNHLELIAKKGFYWRLYNKEESVSNRII